MENKMQLPLVQMDPGLARQKLLEYRAAVADAGGKLASKADHLLKQAYYHASRGRPILSLTAALEAGGYESFTYRGWNGATHEARRPKLAVCAATATTVHLFLDGSTVLFCADREYHAGRRVRPSWRPNRLHGQTNTVSDSGQTVAVRLGERLSSSITGESGGPPDLQALVPTVPPQHRPRSARGQPWGSLEGYFLLWEAEWRLSRPQPPLDPALLKHIGGDLFVVRASWDLTELERLVLAHGPR